MEQHKEMEEEEEQLSSATARGQYPPGQARRVSRFRRSVTCELELTSGIDILRPFV